MIKLQRIVCPTDLSEDSERTIRYAVALTRASGAKLFVCYRPKTPADQKWALATIEKLITAGLTFPSGVSHDPSPIEWESVLLDDSDLGTIITREAESRRADLIFMRSRRRPLAAALLYALREHRRCFGHILIPPIKRQTTGPCCLRIGQTCVRNGNTHMLLAQC
jgi:nucleotide-binding universal stress UspA family protein